MMKFLKKYHKWVGLLFAFFLLMSAISGIMLNHRKVVSSLDISRSLLPGVYQYNNWNNASVKGSIKLSPDSVLVYGGAGIWLTDTLHSSFADFNKGLKKGTDNQIISRIVYCQQSFFAASTFDLYQLREDGSWQTISDRIDNKERIADLVVKGDTLVVVSRSNIYIATAPFTHFQKSELPQPEGYTRKATLFRTLWLLHSGELFGLPGQLFVDSLGILVIILCITGLIYFICPGIIRRKKKKNKPTASSVSHMKWSIRWHNKVGSWFLIFLLILTISGMFLRPPLLIAIIRSQVKTLPGTILNSDNPWHDKLRMLRYDTTYSEWILYSSSGFYRMKELTDTPMEIVQAPPVSVMGATVLEQIDATGWIVGSFSGLYYWDREDKLIVDSYTGRLVEAKKSGRPVANNPVSGYAGDFADKLVIFEYNRGAIVFDSEQDFAPMPDSIQKGRMSLWHLCLEIHTGRIYEPIIGFFSDLYVFLLGFFTLFVLLSGYIIYKKRYKRKGK
ncbi:hypothetical protein M2459_003049 [Parabacteroides sp. PF5-5]|uniref:PepSY-associated TM helix domain-containing protein n=1 Tax=unclassified Parabacteroides TaxID=2649774 RepID=UPI00247CECE3|nr:hypothetical protein [Parabacteroides sp. PH5-39]MDH6317348.1 hypothetical protein [Parabacteroides sp. PF5-13]MDH6320556.1 hypothetical protein [Parabacteroides sp. PH5-13]MDH6324281.1 hypothetical protein [Parabacteroides sp. PH5-8]MDH6328478.1 hypothetical protein [Parabacteroides sp. PH5-41]MDH6336280.1 hypothetical protein [Parabacteroides sp. PF5-5]MDH6347399.1 hypothetical protein [Parabacteroides sp. PH5-46]MDH6362306.1 hypothetical protein [Parabacteroides sp. PH5-16]MDH6377974.